MSEKSRKIKGLLMMRGITVTSIAKSMEVSLTFVSLVINEKKKSKRIQEYVAQLLGLTYSELWEKKLSDTGAEIGIDMKNL
jgi:lambda repressor-like predicted transcriptional regulator